MRCSVSAFLPRRQSHVYECLTNIARILSCHFLSTHCNVMLNAYLDFRLCVKIDVSWSSPIWVLLCAGSSELNCMLSTYARIISVSAMNAGWANACAMTRILCNRVDLSPKLANISRKETFGRTCKNQFDVDTISSSEKFCFGSVMKDSLPFDTVETQVWECGCNRTFLATWILFEVFVLLSSF